MKRMTILTLTVLLLTTSCRLSRGPSAGRATQAPPTPALTVPAPASASAAPVLNVRYSDEATERKNSLSLDIYPVADAQSSPVMIFVHGGGWFRGDKSGVDVMAQAYNQNGFILLSINYRLIPEVRTNQQMQDVARAVAWTKENISKYGGNPARIFLMGHSAGAHLVSLLGTDEIYLKAEGLALTDIKGIVSLDTQTYDLHTLVTNLPKGTGEVYTEAFGTDPEFLKKMSPLTHVKAGKKIPPFLIAYTGEKTTRVYFSNEFYKALQEAGIPSTLLPATEKTHGQIMSEFGMPNDRVSSIVFDWLRSVLQNL
ncbi:MAG: alpha/beta hydrolase [Chloroflexi bacterium]|nr:alpha/beta hydrolase [Chloroflexota bacterium]